MTAILDMIEKRSTASDLDCDTRCNYSTFLIRALISRLVLGFSGI